MAVPEDRLTLPAFIAERLMEPRAVALAERRDGRTVALSSGEVHRRAAAVACGLRARGLRAGDRVALVAANRVDWLVADFGILYAGCVVVPLFATTAADQIQYIVDNSEARFIIADDDAAVSAIRAACPQCPPIVAFDHPAGRPDSFEALVREGTALYDADPGALAGFTAAIAPDELAVLIYTSGTTGIPKGVMLSHRNLLSNVYSAFDPQQSALVAGERVLSVLPFAHIYEHTNSLGYLYNKAQHYVTTPERLLEDLRALHPAHIAFVPRIFERLLAGIVASAQAAGGVKAKLVPWAIEVGTAYERKRREGPRPSLLLRLQNALAHALVLNKVRPSLGLDNMNYVVSGSAPLHKDVALTLAAMGIEIREGYGQTETAPIVTVNRPSDNVLGSVGAAIDGVHIKIADDGEILVKGPNVMMGYYKLPASEQPFTPDGWLMTGDIGRLDEAGHLFITDRKRELFKTSGGKWISPARIETAIKRSVYIGQVMAFGDDRPHPAVLVAPNWGFVRQELQLPADMPTELVARRDDVRALMVREVEKETADLAKYEQVHRIAILPRDLTIEDGELSPTLKIKRRVVEQRYAPLLAEAYAEDLHARVAAAG